MPHLQQEPRLLSEQRRHRAAGGRLRQLHLEAAVAGEGHLQQRHGDAAVADVVPGADAALPQQRLRRGPHAAQRRGRHVGHLVADLRAAGQSVALPPTLAALQKRYDGPACMTALYGDAVRHASARWVR